MKSFQEFILIAEAAYDASIMGSSQIRRSGEGGRVGAERKKSTPEIRRTKRVGGGQTAPSTYKPRKDIGTQKSADTRVQQPTQERGSSDVKAKAAAAAKEERKKAALARIAAKKSGGEAPSAKPKEAELKKQASKLLTKKAEEKPKAEPKDSRFSSSRKSEDHMIKGKYTKAEKKTMVRAGKQKLRDIVLKSTGKKKESELKHKYTGPDKD
jgi:hypothetical protein